MNDLLLKVLRNAKKVQPELRIKKNDKLAVAIDFDEETGLVECEVDSGINIDYHMDELELWESQYYGEE